MGKKERVGVCEGPDKWGEGGSEGGMGTGRRGETNWKGKGECRRGVERGMGRVG